MASSVSSNGAGASSTDEAYCLGKVFLDGWNALHVTQCYALLSSLQWMPCGYDATNLWTVAPICCLRKCSRRNLHTARVFKSPHRKPLPA